VHNVTGSAFADDWLPQVLELVDNPECAARARAGRTRLLTDKIDTTTWMVGFFEQEFAKYFLTGHDTARTETTLKADNGRR